MSSQAGRESTAPQGEWLWLNGELVPAAAAALSPFDRGFLYGDGLFETLRSDRGRVCYLDRHLRRLFASAARLRLAVRSLEALPWSSVAADLLMQNGLDQQVARIKLVVTRGVAFGPGLPTTERPTVLITASPYRSPSDQDYARGWRLHLAQAGFVSPLAGHKTLNYLTFLAARQEALDLGQDEAVLVGPEGQVCETTTGSLLCRRDGTWLYPEHPLQLPSVTLARTLELLRQRHLPVKQRPLEAGDLIGLDGLWVLNSLIGIMPVRAIDGRPIASAEPPVLGEIRERLLLGG